MRSSSPSKRTTAALLSLRCDGNILLARLARGADSQADRIACWRKIIATAHARGCRKLLLIDREDGSRIGGTELVELVLLLRADASRFDRIAVVEPAREVRATISHGEAVARALGIPVRLFDDRASARAWLLEATD